MPGCNAARNVITNMYSAGFQGYWMVKRAVGTKACLLGRAVTCRYLREDNFLEVVHLSCVRYTYVTFCFSSLMNDVDVAFFFEKYLRQIYK